MRRIYWQAWIFRDRWSSGGGDQYARAERQSFWHAAVIGQRVDGDLGDRQLQDLAALRLQYGWPAQLFSFADRKLKANALVENYPEWGMTVSPDERWLLYT